MLLAVGFQLVATLLWNHHRVDSTLTFQLKICCGLLGIGVLAVALHSAWLKRYLASGVMIVGLGVLLYVHWRPIAYP